MANVPTRDYLRLLRHKRAGAGSQPLSLTFRAMSGARWSGAGGFFITTNPDCRSAQTVRVVHPPPSLESERELQRLVQLLGSGGSEGGGIVWHGRMVAWRTDREQGRP